MSQDYISTKGVLRIWSNKVNAKAGFRFNFWLFGKHSSLRFNINCFLKFTISMSCGCEVIGFSLARMLLKSKALFVFSISDPKQNARSFDTCF